MSSLSKDELSQLGANGKEYYEKNFTKEQRMEQLMGLISSSTYSNY
jgi:hypothetical protein